MKNLFSTLFFLLTITYTFSQQKNYKRVSINASNSFVIQQLEDQGIDLNCGAILKDNKLQLELSEDELSNISNSGISYRVLIDDLTSFYSERAKTNLPLAKSELNSQKLQKSTSAKFGQSSLKSILNDNIGQYNECDEIDWPVPTNFKLGSMGGCFTVTEALAELDLMRSLYPNLISVKADASPTNQTTIEGRTTYYVRISDNPDIDEPSEPETLYTGMTHSRELSSLMNLMYYMWYVLENYATDPAIKNLVDNQALYFIPIVNSDGLAYNESVAPSGGGLQRKNRNIYSGSCSTYTEGVDLNRNFGYYWNNGGSSSSSCSETYRGPTHFSEPETQIVRDFFLQHDFQLILNHHSFKNAMLHGYAGVDPADLDAAGVDRHEDKFAKYNHDMTYFNRYAYGPSTQISALNSGNTNDWMMGPAVAGPTGGPGSGKNSMAWTPENGSSSEAGSTGSGFWPDPIFIDDIAKRAMRGNFLAAYYSGKYAKLIDLTASDINALSGNLDFGIEFLGRTSSNFTLTVTPISSNITSITNPSVQSSMTTLEQRNVSAAYILDGSIQVNDEIEFQVALSNDDGVLYEATIIKYYTPSIAFLDNPDTDGISNWTTSGGTWGTETTIGFNGASTTVITDSPSGAYSNNESKTLQLNTTINTSSVSETIIQYYAKWDLERSFDYVQIEASTNGSSWTPLCTTYTKPGAPDDNNSYSGKSTANNNFQPDGEPLYDGDTQDKWVMEEVVIDASNNSVFNGQAIVYLRFNFNTDSTNSQDSYTTTFDGFAFDDFRVVGIQIPCVTSVPTGLNTSTVTTVAATIDWDIATSATYDLRYKETSSSTWIELLDISGTSTSLTGLTSSTNYEVQIRSRCTSTTSTYSASVNFTTDTTVACSGTSINTFPYNESFESGLVGDWTQDATDDLDWLANSGTTPSANTGPSSATDGTNYIFVEASVNGTGYPDKRAILTSPCLDLSNLSEATFNFAYHMYGATDVGTIDLEISNDDGATWTSLWNQSGNQGDSWFTIDINLNAYVGGSIKLRFNRFVGSTWQADIALDDINLTGIEGADTTPPVITLNGAASIDINIGDSYTELGASASDNVDGDISANIIVGGDIVNTNVIGTYIITYNVSDAAGNTSSEVIRTVNIIPDTTAPIITLIGATTVNLYTGDVYTEEGATASDNVDGDITANIVIGGDIVDTNIVGTYIITYNVSDTSGNAATQVNRIVNISVFVDTVAPVITLNGAASINLIVGDTYTESGATASDNVDGDITSNIVIGGDAVNTNNAGTYIVTYNVNDTAGNTAIQVSRTINIAEPVTGCSGGITLYPYANGLEGSIATWTQDATDDLDWLVNSGTTPSANTGPSSAIEGSDYIFVEASVNGTGYPDKRAILTSPCFDLSGLSDATFSFSYHMYGATDMGTIDLEISNDDGASWVSIWNQSGNQGNSWLTINQNLNAYLGGNIQLRFNRFVGSTWQADIAIDDINLTVIEGADTTIPVITLNGASTINLNVGDSYSELGATANDNIDGDISANIVIAGDTVDTNVAGAYTITYDVSDAAGNNSTQVTRTVNVIPDTTIPVITLNGASSINLNVGDAYSELGATANDNIDGDISANIVIAGDTVDTNVAGAYTITYDVSDAAGNNSTQVTRTVNVIPDTTIPVITLNGASIINLNVGDAYSELGATANDNIDGDISANIVIAGDTVDTNVAGAYTITYDVSDAAGNNSTQVTRTVNVIPDTTIPVITLNGASIINLNVGDAYSELGATANDNIDGDISANIVIAGDTVDTNVAGAYTITYDVSDAAGNNSTQVTRTVNVIPDTTIPVITLNGASIINLNVGDAYSELGATANDNIDGDISANIVIAGDTVDTNAAGAYTITYDVSDAAGNNSTQVTRTVNVIPDTTIPVITLNGASSINLNVGDAYSELGATANDNIDGDISANIVIAGDTVDTNAAGAYIITYDVSDAAGNNATQVTRTVNVISIPTDVILHEGYFETGLDGWTDGGNDCVRRLDAARSFENSYSIRIRDNSGVASSMTSPTFNLSSFNEVEFNFHFYSNSMEVGEDFWLQYNDGSGFVTIAAWARGTDFNNNAFGNFAVTLNSSQYNLASNGQFRLQCDASGNNDQIFIDQVIITGRGSNGNTVKTTSETGKVLSVTEENLISKNELRLYPNPVKGNILNIKLSNQVNRMSYRIINSLGQVIKSGETRKEVIVNDLQAGVYFIEVNDGAQIMTKRFIKSN